MHGTDEGLERERRRATTRVLERLGITATSIGDELFVDGIVIDALAALRRTDDIRLERRRTRAVTTTVVDAVSEELRRSAPWAAPARVRAVESALRAAAVADAARRTPYPSGADPIDLLIEHHVLALAADDRDTAEHSRAVASWARRVAERLGMSRPDVAFVRRCGLIHDVGKRETPKEILHAPRALTEEEWRRMRCHVIDGFAAVKADPVLAPFALCVRNHHERFDGSGYPDGLSGDDIPLAVRIVTVADAFNAMVAPRAYRASFSPAQAIDELTRHRGSQFDPRVVDAMIDVILSPGDPS